MKKAPRHNAEPYAKFECDVLSPVHAFIGYRFLVFKVPLLAYVEKALNPSEAEIIRSEAVNTEGEGSAVHARPAIGLRILGNGNSTLHERRLL